MEELYSIKVKDKQLLLRYSKAEEGLYNYHSSDRLMYSFTHDHTKEAFSLAVKKETDKLFVLNIASTENFGMFEWKDASDILHRQLDIFMPIIQLFMEYALTGRLFSSQSKQPKAAGHKGILT